MRPEMVKNDQYKRMTDPGISFRGKESLPLVDIDRVVEMAWEDRTSFDALERQFGLNQEEVIQIMRRELKPRSFQRWRQRTKGRSTKHELLREEGVDRFKCSRQRTISGNKISKR